mmetsp:Transcript_18184/g.28104  ORF Transcript_18184/g.28104 Transcript_18184/m.28104 type:complete len:107 (+) Transcript_18184:2-322(+)
MFGTSLGLTLFNHGFGKEKVCQTGMQSSFGSSPEVTSSKCTDDDYHDPFRDTKSSFTEYALKAAEKATVVGGIVVQSEGLPESLQESRLLFATLMETQTPHSLKLQ